jgi:hypothetical protein
MENRVAPAITVLFFIFLMGLSIFSVSYDARPFSGNAMTSGTVQLAALYRSAGTSTST